MRQAKKHKHPYQPRAPRGRYTTTVSLSLPVREALTAWADERYLSISGAISKILGSRLKVPKEER